MKLTTSLFSMAIIFASLVTSMSSAARDEVGDYSISDALATEKAQEVLGDEIKFYFGSQGHRAVAKRIGNFQSNKKTNAFGKSDTQACNWAFLSAMKTLKDRAISEGANAVINIKSNYKGNSTSSRDTFACGAGNVIAGVTLTGDVVRLK